MTVNGIDPAAPDANAAPQPQEPALQPVETPAPQPAAAPATPPAEAAPQQSQPAELKTMLADEQQDDQGEPFTVEIPEGFVADKDGVSFLEAKVKDGTLSKEAAQELAKTHAEGIRRYEANLIANAQKRVDEWEGEIKSHPEYGGVKLDQSVQHAKLMLQKFATPKMIEDFKSVGILSHPDFFVMLNRMHGATSEGVSIGGAGQATPEKDAASVLFPDFK